MSMMEIRWKERLKFGESTRVTDVYCPLGTYCYWQAIFNIVNDNAYIIQWKSIAQTIHPGIKSHIIICGL